MSQWPGGDRRDPSATDRHYLALRPLSTALQGEVAKHLTGRSGLDVLDIGCGVKPYQPFFAPYAATHRGLDAVPGPYVDDVGHAEALPYEDESFDVILCTQVFEHLHEPWTAVKEMRRVLRPGGLALVSTHGVFLYHPDPPGSDQDYWRWTHSGLRRLFESHGTWNSIGVEGCGEMLSCVGYVLAQFLGEAVDRAPLSHAGALAMRAFNRSVERMDRRFPPRARTPAGGSISSTYLVSATRSGA